MPNSFVPNRGEINRLLHEPSGPVWPFMRAFGRDVETRARRKALVDHGELRASTNATPLNLGPSGLSLAIGSSARHAMVIHQGHGVIRPKRGKYLRFQPKDLRGTGKFVLTTKVRAVGGYPYLTAALREANANLPTDRQFRIIINAAPLRGAPPRGAPRL